MTADSSNVYAKCSLSLTRAQIRVFDLRPGDVTDQLQGSFRILDLASAPYQYECISYVWGNSAWTKPVVVDKDSIAITKNLDDALQRIRSKTENMAIWADAICINQADFDERSYQVAIMTDIYRRCSKVHIWLGHPEPGTLTGNPFAFLEHFTNGKHFYDFPGFSRNTSTGLWVWKENIACSDILNDFLQVIQSPWWTRAWTVQECLLPENNLVMFGDWTITWDLMLKAEQMKNSHGDGPAQCCKEAVNVFNPHQLRLINEWMWHPGQGQKLMDILHGNPRHSRPQYYETILAYSTRRCLDPRDKIYSMLSLATHPIYRDFTPNYREDVTTVYTDIFTRMIRENEGRLTCFMGGGFGSTMPKLPSWVRDFSQSKPLGIAAVEQRRIWYVSLYQASCANPLQPLWNERNELHYRGTYVDTVKAIGSYYSAPGAAVREVFGQWLDLCKEAMGSCEPSVLRNTFSRVICGDVCKTLDGDTEFRRARETDFPDESKWNRLVDGDLSTLDPRAYGWGVTFGVTGRCLFTTSSGRIGLCHPNVRPGDEVWIMRGMQVTFAVRPLEPSSAGCASQYSFLGDCFTNGVMDGESGEKERSAERRIIMI